LWSSNDHGDKARIFNFDTKGMLLKTFYLQGVDAKDFEALACNSENGDLFIGDIGNNENIRFDLCIYRVSREQYDKSQAEKPYPIPFFYEDQKSFPPSQADRDFDCEALFYFKDSLYLFTKNRSGDLFSVCYSLPAYASTGSDSSVQIIATRLDSVKLTRWVTSADISPDGKKVVLLSETRFWLFYDFPERNFFKGKMKEIMFNGYTQKEGVAFADNDTIYLTDEKTISRGGYLYKVNLNEFLNDQK
jgi:hypothetical protein